jgi:hypothetical protein
MVIAVAGVEDHGTECSICARPLSQWATRQARDGNGLRVPWKKTRERFERWK